MHLVPTRIHYSSRSFYGILSRVRRCLDLQSPWSISIRCVTSNERVSLFIRSLIQQLSFLALHAACLNMKQQNHEFHTQKKKSTNEINRRVSVEEKGDTVCRSITSDSWMTRTSFVGRIRFTIATSPHAKTSFSYYFLSICLCMLVFSSVSCRNFVPKQKKKS